MDGKKMSSQESLDKISSVQPPLNPLKVSPVRSQASSSSLATSSVAIARRDATSASLEISYGASRRGRRPPTFTLDLPTSPMARKPTNH
ncbi:hypothetical protein HPP92_015976 [Vanilla planifolia]|uniref:Uncharacterized protein n=1 Tax=Vanilla planifolia TaxID=51239 RepID=A0A835QQG2_VANPL|nr:hypothetical protein HPP92_015976 [Vanilla planifolia]